MILSYIFIIVVSVIVGKIVESAIESVGTTTVINGADVDCNVCNNIRQENSVCPKCRL